MSDDSDIADLQELKDTYSFNESLLKKCFIDEGVNIFQKYQLLAKIHNLLFFRKKYEAKFNFPQLLFTFNNKVDESSTINKSIIGYFCSISKLNQIQTQEISSKLNLSQNTSEKNHNDLHTSNEDSTQEQNPIKMNTHFDISDFLIRVFLTTQTDYVKSSEDDEKSILNSETHYNWIIDYFVYSTFPSLFGHFCSVEYLREGYSFISLLINDKIAPRLVGSFLHHSFLFKDRVLNHFFCNVSKKFSHYLSSDPNSETFYSNDNNNTNFFTLETIETLFYESFSSCISYFSFFHFKAVDLLLKIRGDSAAIEAIWDHFIFDEFVENWNYHPLFSSISKNKNELSAINDDVFPHYQNFLNDALHRISNEKNKEAQMKYVNLFKLNSNINDNQNVIYFNMPKISDIIFFKGIFFAITKLDLNLGLILRNFLRQISSSSSEVTYDSVSSSIINYPGMKITKQSDTQLAYNSVHILLRLSHIFPNQEIFPKPPDPNKSTIYDRLMYNKDVHNILYKRAGGLVTAKSILGSIEKNIILISSSYAIELYNIQKNKQKQSLNSNDKIKFNAAIYGETQRRHFVLHIIEMIVNSTECFAQFFHSLLGPEFPNALGGDASNMLKVNLSEEWANAKEKSHFSNRSSSSSSSQKDEDQIYVPKIGVSKSLYSLSSSESSVSDFSMLPLEIVSRSIIKTAEKIINSWKFVYNGNIEMDPNKNQQKLKESDLKVELFQPVTGIFVFVTNEITKFLVYYTLSNIPHPIIPKIESKKSTDDELDSKFLDFINKERINVMHSIVNSKSLRVPFLDSSISLSFCLADPYISFYIDVAHDVQCFLLLLEKSFENEFVTQFKSKDNHNFVFCEQYNIGWKMQAFIQLEKMLNPILNNSKLNQNTIKMLMTALFKGNDPFYLRLNLINVSRTVKSLCTLSEDNARRYSNPTSPIKNVSILPKNDINTPIQKVEDEKFVGKINSLLIYDIFGQSIVDKFKNLLRWFSLMETV